MNSRRQFLGAITAGCMACGVSTAMANPLFASSENKTADDLNWRCDVIKSIAHNKTRQNPVITGVCLQPKGTQLAIVGDDHGVNIYNRAQSSYTDHLNVHSDWVRATRFTPDGQKLITAGNDQTVCVWNAADWRMPISTRKHDAAIIGVAVSHDSKRFATVGFEKTLRIYDFAFGQEPMELQCACNDNHAVAFSDDDKMIAAGGRCGTLLVWDVATGKKLAQVKAHRKRIRSIEFTADGRVISASDDQQVQITNPNNPNQTVAFPRHASKLYSTALLDDGLFATGGSDNKIHVWQLDGLKEVGTLSGHTGTVSSLDYVDRTLVSGSFDTQVRLWSTESYTSNPTNRQTQATPGWNARLK